MRFCDCQGLGGHGTTLGAVQAGFEMVHRATLTGGFGDAIVDANRAILQFSGDTETGAWDSWTPQKSISYLAGVPPCSGFSLMNTAAARAKARGEDAPANSRGAGSSINLCQRALIEYAARCTGSDDRSGPEFVAFESVQGAFNQGIELMREYWQALSVRTGKRYNLSHVKMSVGTIGGAQFRHRYFFVAHRVPFGIDAPTNDRLTTVGDAIGDLEDAKLQWGPQPYPSSPTRYSHPLRDSSGFFQDHVAAEGSWFRIFQELLPYWGPGKAMSTAAKGFLADGRPWPDGMVRLERKWIPEEQQFKGFMWPYRTAYDEPAPVLTGSCAGALFHPVLPRFLTARELARLMEVPDAWVFDGTVKNPQGAGTLLGKNCTTRAGRWIATAVRDALAGTPQSSDHEFWHTEKYKGIELLPGERVYDSTLHYKTYGNFFRRSR